MERTRREALVLVAGIGIGVILMAVGFVLTRQNRPAPIVIEPPPPTGTAPPPATPGPLRVYVSGQVAHADVYELPPGSIVADVIELAGSFTAEAAVDAVNLAQPLADGMHVYVPAVGEAAAPPPSAPVNALMELGSGTEEKVNINGATLEELDTLPGVGPATALKIVEYREANGPFAKIEEIMEVSGIGEAKFDAMKEYLAVE